MFEHVEVNAYDCVAKDMRMVRDFWNAKYKDRKNEVALDSREGNGMWVRPVAGTIKVNVDASFCLKSGRSAIGIIARDERGFYLGGMGEEVAASSAFMAESLALMTALEQVERLGYDRVFIETDCTILALSIKEDKKSSCSRKCEDIVKKSQTLLHQNEGWSVSFVSRAGNEAADRLAAEAIRGMVSKGWLLQPPSPLCRVLAKDMEDSEGFETPRTGIG